MCSTKIEKSDELINSDINMLAANSFNSILNHIQNSSLNYQLQLSPFSALVSIKKSFIKDKSGQTVLPPECFITPAYKSELELRNESSRYEKLKQEFEELRSVHEELVLKLASASSNIQLLQTDIREKVDIINDLEA